MDTIPEVPQSFYDAEGAIADDHDCKRCGYNLRGLGEDGRCPECGTPIGLSMRGDLLRFADPDWVDKVALGIKLILWMILASIVLSVGAGISGAGPLFVGALQLAVAIVSFYGAWLMTEPDPSGIGEDPNLTARKVVCITLVVGLIGTLPQMFVLPGAGMQIGAIVVLVIAGLAGLIGLVGEFFKFIYYEQLARRIPNGALAQRSRLLKWGFTITLAVMLIGGLAVLVIQPWKPAGAGAPAGMNLAVGGLACGAVFVGLAFLVFGVMTVFLLVRLRRAIAEQAVLARESWMAVA